MSDFENSDFVATNIHSQGVSESSSQTTESTSASQDPLAERLYWKDENDPDDGTSDPRTFAFKPERLPGLQFGFLTRQATQAFKKPVDFLYLFLTQGLILQLCIETNHYAEKVIAEGQNLSYASGDGTWSRVTVEEMYRFIGIITYMSVVKLPTLERHWSKSSLYKTSVVSTVMTINRFKSILSFIQINFDADKDDKLTRVRPLLEHVEKTSQALFQPFEAVSVDERMVASKHQYSGIRQFIKDKPIRFGLKLWVLADAISGYTFAFFVYLGKKRTNLCEKMKGLAYNVVMELSKKLYNQGYRIYTDSFYTTQHLATDLLQKRTYLIGAVKRTSSAMPPCLKDIEQFEKCSTRGDFRWHRENKFVYVQWRDCKTVTIMSPLHKGSATGFCYRTVNERLGYKKKKMVQHSVIQDYNSHMGGVDKSNQMLNKYPCYIKSIFHWWKVLFFHSIDIMIVNSFIILQEFVKQNPNQIEGVNVSFGQLEYREALALSLMQLDNDIHSSQCMPGFLEKRVDCTYCNAKASLLGNKVPSIKTDSYCVKCEIPLCIRKERNCFQSGIPPKEQQQETGIKLKAGKGTF